MNQDIELTPEAREARADESMIARLALWLAEVSADAALAPLRDEDDPSSNQREPE